jgi:uncharacterized repeat protein (TIGR01451 family)
MAVALGSGATAAGSPVAASRPAIEIVSSPRVQTVQTRIVIRADAKTGTRTRTLMFGTARFTITVTNPSRVGLSGVTVTDPLSPGCNRRIGKLAPGTSITYSCSEANVRRSYTNVVTASGRSQGVRNLTSARARVTATAASTVSVKAKVTAQGGVPSFTG